MDTPEEIAKFFEKLYEHTGEKIDPEDKWKDVDVLEDQLEVFRASNRCLHGNFRAILQKDEFNINAKYVNLKEKRDLVLDEIQTLESQLEKLKVSISDEKQKMVLEAENNVKRAEEIQRKRIQEIREQIEVHKQGHRRRVEKLKNELDLAQAAADLEQDEIETSLRRELIDLNTKIRRVKQINTDMQVEIEDLTKRQQAISAVSRTNADLDFFQLVELDELFEGNPAGVARVDPTPPQLQEQRKSSLAHGFQEPKHVGNDHAEDSRGMVVVRSGYVQNPMEALAVNQDTASKSAKKLADATRVNSKARANVQSAFKGKLKETNNKERKETANMRLNPVQKFMEKSLKIDRSISENVLKEFKVKTENCASAMVVLKGNEHKSGVKEIRTNQKRDIYHTPLYGYVKNQASIKTIEKDIEMINAKVELESHPVNNVNNSDGRGKMKQLSMECPKDPKGPNKKAKNRAKQCENKQQNNFDTIPLPNKNNPPKRRKLFNLDNLDYLDAMQLSSDDSD